MNERLKKFLFPTEDETFLNNLSISNNEEDNNINNTSYNTSCTVYDINEQESEQYNPTQKENLVFNPTSFKESEDIATEIIKGNIVIVNLENILLSENGSINARRMIDFLCGVSFAIKGNVKRINDSTFMFQI